MNLPLGEVNELMLSRTWEQNIRENIMKKARSKCYTLGSCAHISTKQIMFCCRELLMHTDLGAHQKCTQGLLHTLAKT